jgi:hypothetical protein
VSETKTARATVELTKNEDGTWLNVEIGGRKASLCVERGANGLRSPMVSDIFREWSESHFTPAGPARKVLALLSECLLAGAVTLVLISMIAGVVWLVYEHAGSLAEGFGAALAAGLLGGTVRYFKTTRRLLHKLTFGKMFR